MIKNDQTPQHNTTPNFEAPDWDIFSAEKLESGFNEGSPDIEAAFSANTPETDFPDADSQDANFPESDTDSRIVSSMAAKPDTEEARIEFTLRPKTLGEFVGQAHIKEPLDIALRAAHGRGEAMEHILLYGNPGLGKTTLANIIAKEMNVSLRVTAGPALERVGDLAAILSNLGAGDVLFIDEIHRMGKAIEEVLYSAMEDYALDIIVGKGPAARTVRMPLERFTLIGATTKLNLLSGPLRDRFGHVYHLNFYEPEDISEIVARNAKLLEVEIDDAGANAIAARARRTPRVANRLLKSVRDYTQVKHNGIITEDIARGALGLLDIDELGLDAVDRKILHAIIHTFAGGPVGLSTLAAAVAEDMDTIETIYEPYLLQIGMLERTPRGRRATGTAHQHIGAPQKTLL